LYYIILPVWFLVSTAIFFGVFWLDFIRIFISTFCRFWKIFYIYNLCLIFFISFLFYFCLIKILIKQYFFRRIWFLRKIISFFLGIFFFKLSLFSVKKIDTGWLENYGPQGLYLLYSQGLKFILREIRFSFFFFLFNFMLLTVLLFWNNSLILKQSFEETFIDTIFFSY
jgi:hypothetical protein